MQKLQKVFKRKGFVNGYLIILKKANESTIAYAKKQGIENSSDIVKGMIREKIFTNKEIKDIIKAEMRVAN